MGTSNFSNQTLQDASEYTQQEICHCDGDHKHIGTQVVYHSSRVKQLKVENSAMPQTMRHVLRIVPTSNHDR
jgi:hypothetical protein